MNHKLNIVQAVLVTIVVALAVSPLQATGSRASSTYSSQGGSAAAPQVPVGSGFSYQGQLKVGGNPANGQYDFTFALFDALSGCCQQGSTITMLNQTVANGLFTILLDFGSTPFQGDGRWMEIAVRQAGGGTYTTLSPRQTLSAAPYASSLVPGASVSGNSVSPVISATNTGSGYGLEGNKGSKEG